MKFSCVSKGSTYVAYVEHIIKVGGTGEGEDREETEGLSLFFKPYISYDLRFYLLPHCSLLSSLPAPQCPSVQSLLSCPASASPPRK